MDEDNERGNSLFPLQPSDEPVAHYLVSSNPTLRPLLWTTIGWAGYAACFFVLHLLFGGAVSALIVLPVVLVGWLWGFRAGLLAGLLSLPLNTILLNIAGEPGWDIVFRIGGGPGTIAVFLLGGIVGYLRDLRQRLMVELHQHQQTEEKLHQSEERYRHIVEDQTDFIVRWLPDGKRLFVNDAYCQHFGQTKEELIGSSFFPLVHEADQAAIRAKIALLAPTDPIAKDEHRSILPDGSIRWHRWIDRAFFDENGRIIELQSVGRDITEEKMAEQRLRESEHRYQVLSEITSDYAGSFRLDADGRLTQEWISGAFSRITGYTPEEIEQMGGLMAIVHPEDQADARQKMAAILKGKSFEDEYRIITKEGQVRWLRAHIQVELHSETGQPSRFYAAAKDITPTKEAEMALKQSEVLYRSLAESSGVGIWQITPEGYTIYINPAMCALLGLPDPEVLFGKTYHKYFTAESLETMKRHHARRLAGTASSYEVEIIRTDGQKRNVIVYGAPVLTT